MTDATLRFWLDGDVVVADVTGNSLYDGIPFMETVRDRQELQDFVLRVSLVVKGDMEREERVGTPMRLRMSCAPEIEEKFGAAGPKPDIQWTSTMSGLN